MKLVFADLRLQHRCDSTMLLHILKKILAHVLKHMHSVQTNSVFLNAAFLKLNTSLYVQLIVTVEYLMHVLCTAYIRSINLSSQWYCESGSFFTVKCANKELWDVNCVSQAHTHKLY